MEFRPSLEVPDQFFDFGVVGYDRKVTKRVAVAVPQPQPVRIY